MIQAQLNREELAQVVREAVRMELEPIKVLFENRKLTVKETMSILGIKSAKTILNLVRDGKLNSYPDRPNGHPKFLYSEVLTYKNMKRL